MKLLALDIDGTVIRSFMREGGKRADYDIVELLPWCAAGTPWPVPSGWQEGEGFQVVLVTNQGGVAHGYQTVAQVCSKIMRTFDALFGGRDMLWANDCIRCGPARDDLLDWRGLPFGGVRRPRAYVAFGLKDARLPRFKIDADDPWRKPGPGMLRAALRDYDVSAEDALFVGDMDSDRGAAEAAGVPYMDAADFFRGDDGDG